MERRLLLAVVIGTLVSASNTSDIIKCKSFCRCNKTTGMASCNSRRLIYIPRLPDYITKVKFVQNNFSYIDRDFFKNLTYNRITLLNLTDNLIRHISEDAFKDLRYLVSVEVSKEPSLNISMLQKSLYSLPKTLTFVQFSGNAWKQIPRDMFTAFSDSSQTTFNLSLIRNNIQSLDGKVFSSLKQLRFLDLSQNVIKTVDVEGLIDVQSLRLSRNFIRDIPTWCGENNQSLVPNLRTLSLGDNSIADMDQSSFRCLGELQQLCLNANNFRTLKTNTFSELRNLQQLNISYNARLQVIEDGAFNVSSMEVLYFKENHFPFNKGFHVTYNPLTLFKYCPKLRVLDMSDNVLPTVNQYSTFQEIFRPLHMLQILILRRASMRALPRDVFSQMKHLEILDLAENYLQGWQQSDRVFGRKPNIKTLNLHSNYIRLVNKTTFPPDMLTSLQKLDLSDNFFLCTCDLLWFRDWIKVNIESANRKTNLTLVGYPQYYKCKLPGDIMGLHLEKYNPTVESCKEKDPMVIVAIATGSVGAFAIVVILILYRCQTNIRNYIYLLRFYKNKKTGYIRLESADEYEYDAFIVYSDSDREWVHNVCVKKLEEEEGLHVCIHHRDFDIGEPVTGNIEKYMSKCRKIVVVMSNNFAESEWCQWEIDLVHERRRRQGKHVSLLVMLRSIDSRHMTNRLRALLDSTPHLTYCSGVGEKVFWAALMKGLRKPVGHPPFAVV